MKTGRKVILTMLCAILVIMATIGGTLAYLTDNDAATNTFTVGNIQITLDETNVDDKLTGTVRDQANAYHLIPGQEYVKDPVVHIMPGSEASYVRMKVTVSDLSGLKAAFPENKYPEFYQDGYFKLEKVVEGWDKEIWPCVAISEDAENNTCTYEFRYHEVVAKNEGKLSVDLPALFTTIVIPGEVNNAELAELEDFRIDVVAHAIQAVGFENNEEGAWAAFDAQHA